MAFRIGSSRTRRITPEEFRRRRQTPSIPVTIEPEIAEQPIYEQPPGAAEARRVDGILKIAQKRNLTSLVSKLELVKRNKQEAEDIKTAQDAVVKQAQDVNLKALIAGFSPDVPKIDTLQAHSFRMSQPGITYDNIVDEARRADGIQAAKAFQRSMDGLSEEEVKALGPISAGLAKEGITAERYRQIVEAIQGGNLSVRRGDPSFGEKAGELIGRGAPFKAEVFTSSGTRAETFDEDFDKAERIFFQINGTNLRDEIPAETLAETPIDRRVVPSGTTQGDLDRESPFAFVDPGKQAETVFRFEQEEIASRTRGPLTAAADVVAKVIPNQVPGNSETAGKLFAEILVPTTVLPFIGQAGKAGKALPTATRLKNFFIRGGQEGVINLEQAEAGVVERGEAPLTTFEKGIALVAGGVLGGGAPEVVSKFGDTAVARAIGDKVREVTSRGTPDDEVLARVIEETTDSNGKVLPEFEQKIRETTGEQFARGARLEPETTARATVPEGDVPRIIKSEAEAPQGRVKQAFEEEVSLGTGERRVIQPTGRTTVRTGDLVARKNAPDSIFGRVVRRTERGVEVEARGTGKISRFTFKTAKQQLIGVTEGIESAEGVVTRTPKQTEILDPRFEGKIPEGQPAPPGSEGVRKVFHGTSTSGGQGIRNDGVIRPTISSTGTLPGVYVSADQGVARTTAGVSGKLANEGEDIVEATIPDNINLASREVVDALKDKLKLTDDASDMHELARALQGQGYDGVDLTRTGPGGAETSSLVIFDPEKVIIDGKPVSSRAPDIEPDTPVTTGEEALASAEADMLNSARVPKQEFPDMDMDTMRTEVQDAAVQRRLALETSDSLSSAMGDVVRSGQRKLIRMDTSGKVLDIKGKTGKEPLDWHDVFSNPFDYIWPDLESRQFADTVAAAFARSAKRLDENGLALKRLELGEGEQYIHRVVVEINDRQINVGVRGGIGSKQNFEMPRKVEVASDVGDKVRYENDIGSTIETYWKEVDRRIADADFQKSINKYGTTSAKRIPADIKKARIEAGALRRTAVRRLAVAKSKVSAIKGLTRGSTGAKLEKLKAQLAIGQENVQTKFNDLDAARTVEAEAKAVRARAAVVAGKPRPDERFLPEPFASGRIFPEKVVEKVESNIRARGGNKATRAIISSLEVAAELNSFLKPIQASMDLSYTALQTAGSLGVNPAAWMQMQRTVFMALLNPRHYYDFVQKNSDVVFDMIENGKVPWNRSEFTFGEALEGPYKNQVATLLNIVKPLKLGNDSWNRALNVMSIHLWQQGTAILDEAGEGFTSQAVRRAFGPIARGADAKQMLGNAISHGTGRLGLDEMAKKGPILTLAMRALPFAGNYWEAWGRLITDAVSKGGIKGNTSRKLIAGWMAVGVGMYSAIAHLTGNEINLDFVENPGMFLKLTIPVSDKVPVVGGRGVTVGMGGPLQQLLILSGKIAEDPSDIANITTKFLRGKSSPTVSILTDLIRRETFTGEPLDSWTQRMQYMATRPFPFVIQEPLSETITNMDGLSGQELLNGLKAGLESIPAEGGTFFGLTSFPESLFTIRDELSAQQKVDGKLGRPYNQLSPREKKSVDEADPELLGDIKADLLRRGGEVAQNIAAAKEVNETTKDRIAALAAKVGDGLKGTITLEQFRDGADTARLLGRGGQDIIGPMIEAAGLDPKERPEEPGVLQDIYDYGQLIDQFPTADVDPEAREQLFVALDEFRTRLGLDREKTLDDNLSLTIKEVPLYAELVEDRRVLRESGYWDLNDNAWAELQHRFEGRIDLPDTREEYQVNRIKELEVAGFDSQQAKVIARSDPTLKYHNDILSFMRDRWRSVNRDLIPILEKWGYRSFSASDIGLLNQ